MVATERGLERWYTNTTETFTVGQTKKKIDLEISHNFFNSVKNEDTDSKGNVASIVIV